MAAGSDKTGMVEFRGNTKTAESIVDDSHRCANERRIILLGNTGAGKSATGNTILGKQSFHYSFSQYSVTRKCRKDNTMRNGKLIEVIDTPGLLHTNMSQKDLREEIVKSLRISSPGPHAILCVINAASRQTLEELDALETVVQLFGEHIYQYIIVVFTFCDAIERMGLSFHQYCAEMRKEYKIFVDKCNNRKLAIRNIDEAGKEQVEELCEMIEMMILGNEMPFYTRHSTNRQQIYGAAATAVGTTSTDAGACSIM